MVEVLSKKLFERLLEEARKRDMSVEEFIAESLLKVLNISLDPSDKVELHLKLCEKYLREAEDFLSKKDYVQASEKGWGAAAQIVKALAAKEGKELKSHGELHKEVIRIVKETGDDEIRLLWQSAIALHQNFYENWLPLEMVEKNIGDIKKLVEKLKKLL